MTPIFIGGTGRSGTTILKQVLATHPDVAAIPRELRVIIDPGGLLDLKQALTHRWSPYHADAAVRRFRRLMNRAARTSLLRRAEAKYLPKIAGITPRRYITQGFEEFFGKEYYRARVDQFIDQIVFHISNGYWDGTPAFIRNAQIYEADPQPAEEISRLIRELFSDLFSRCNGTPRPTHWTDDTPFNVLYAHELIEIFPKMKLVHVYRDFRDVLASYYRLFWGGDNWVATSRRIANIVDHWLRIRESLPPGSFLEVSLEKLTSNPEKGVKEICRFTGLPFSEELRSSLSLLDSSRLHQGRWRHEIPKKVLPAVMQNLSPYLQAYGYATE